jgi:transcription antitermination factor NusG
MAGWYAIYTKHQHEKSAEDLLRRKGFETLLPLYQATHQWKDRSKVVALPIFPCYLFLNVDLDRKLEVLTTPGVFFLVENGGRACEVPASDIEALKKIAQSAHRFEPHPFLKSGDQVRICRGPLEGIEGMLVRFKNHYRVVLSIDLLQKAVAVEVDLSIVERTPNNKWRAPATLGNIERVA